MTDLLTHAVESALEDFFASAPEGTDVPVRREAAHRRRTAAPILAAVGATGLVAAGIVAIVVTTGDRAGDSSAGSAAVTGESTPAAAVTTTSVLGWPAGNEPAYQQAVANPGFAPAVLPEGLELRQISPPSPDAEPAQGTLWMVLGRPDGSGGYTDLIHLSVAYGRIFGPPAEQGQYTREGITIAGVPGEIVRDTINHQTTVNFQWGEQVARLQSPTDDADVVEAMIDAGDRLQINEGATTLEGGPPDGYEIVAERTESSPYLDGNAVRLFYSDGTDGAVIDVKLLADPPQGYQYFDTGTSVRPATVRGHEAWVSEIDVPGVDLHTVTWYEQPDLLISVSGQFGPTLDDVIAAAESIRPITDADWEQMQLAAAAVASSSPSTTRVGLTTVD